MNVNLFKALNKRSTKTQWDEAMAQLLQGTDGHRVWADRGNNQKKMWRVMRKNNLGLQHLIKCCWEEVLDDQGLHGYCFNEPENWSVDGELQAAFDQGRVLWAALLQTKGLTVEMFLDLGRITIRRELLRMGCKRVFMPAEDA